MIIRLATSKDVAIITNFNANLAFETEDKVLDKETLTKGVAALLEDPAKGTYYVCEIDGKVVGQMLYPYEWSDWRNGMFWWIQSVYVDKAYRKQGIFKALYQNILEKAQADPNVAGLRLYVEKENHGAKATYEQLGMAACAYDMYEYEK